jgi:hypothetical protein
MNKEGKPQPTADPSAVLSLAAPRSRLYINLMRPDVQLAPHVLALIERFEQVGDAGIYAGAS